MQMLRMQVQNSPQTQQVQVVQSQPQIIQVRDFKIWYFYNYLWTIIFKVASQANGPTPVYISQPSVNPSTSPE